MFLLDGVQELGTCPLHNGCALGRVREHETNAILSKHSAAESVHVDPLSGANGVTIQEQMSGFARLLHPRFKFGHRRKRSPMARIAIAEPAGQRSNGPHRVATAIAAIPIVLVDELHGLQAYALFHNQALKQLPIEKQAATPQGTVHDASSEDLPRKRVQYVPDAELEKGAPYIARPRAQAIVSALAIPALAQSSDEAIVPVAQAVARPHKAAAALENEVPPAHGRAEAAPLGGREVEGPGHVMTLFRVGGIVLRRVAGRVSTSIAHNQLCKRARKA